MDSAQQAREESLDSQKGQTGSQAAHPERARDGEPKDGAPKDGEPKDGVVSLRESLTVASKTENLLRVREFVRATVTRARVPDPYTRHLVLAVDEAVTSILREAAEWAEGMRAEAGAGNLARGGEVQVTLDVDPVRVLAIISDSTTEYGTEGAGVSMQALLDSTRQHELGIFLMRKLCDEVNYSFKKGFENHLELRKFLY